VHERATRLLVDYYKARRVLHVIDGTLAPDLVTARIASAVDRGLTFDGLQLSTVCE